MKKSYKILTLMLALLMVFSLAGCGQSKELSSKIRVGTLVGPTGMGLIDLTDNAKIDLELYQAPTDAVQKLISGNIDVACVPSNLGPTLYAKTDGNIQILTTVVNGVLYVVENGNTVESIKDLKGKTVIASGKGGTPEYAFQALIENAGLSIGQDVQIEWLDSHASVAQKVATTDGAIGLLPEPQVSALKAQKQTVRTALDMNKLWKEMTDQELPMGILVAKKDFIEKNGSDVESLLKLVADSVKDVQGASDEVVDKIVKAGIVPDAELCKAVIPNCSLTCMSAKDSKATLSAFFKKLYKVNPASVGGALPENDIYYGIK